MNEKEKIWIIEGYRKFSELGDKGLKVEQLAKEVGISKSSFYHHFADLEIFIDTLLQHHVKQAASIAQKEKKADTVNPQLIDILLEHKIDILFNRQLRIHSNKQAYRDTLEASNQIIGYDFVFLWLKDTKSGLSFQQAQGLLGLALENFYLQINPDNFNRTWLEEYFENLKRITLSLE